jgi:hypothetical protein
LQALEFLSSRSQSLNALPYLVENAQLLKSEQLRNALIAFAMLKADGEAFRKRQPGDAKLRSDAEHAVENALQMMNGPDFSYCTAGRINFAGPKSCSRRQHCWHLINS